MTTIKIHNVDTDEVIERPMTESELAQWEKDELAAAERIQQLAEKAAARQALLARLGLTEEEAKLLLS